MHRPVAAHASVRRPPFNSLIPPPPTGGDERPCWVTALERALRGSGGVYDYVTWLLAAGVPAPQCSLASVLPTLVVRRMRLLGVFTRVPPPDLTPAATLNGKPRRPKQEGRSGPHLVQINRQGMRATREIARWSHLTLSRSRTSQKSARPAVTSASISTGGRPKWRCSHSGAPGG